MAAPVTPPLWTPSDEFVQRSRMRSYMTWLNAQRDEPITTYAQLWSWSVVELEAFWASIVDYFDVHFHDEPFTILGRSSMPGAQWFPGATVSYPEHIFRGRDEDAVAIRHASELRPLAAMTWGELRALTARIQAGLRACGVRRGDRVVAYMPNIPETIAAFLAVAGLGAIWSSCSPDFGARSVVDRFAQIEPKVLLAVDGYRYGAKDFDRTGVLADLQAQMPTLEHTVVLAYLRAEPDLTGLRGAIGWQELLDAGDGGQLRMEAVPFDHPLWVLYSSGTTGLPKAIVHGHGGILVEQLKKHNLHLDVHAEDRIFWFTTTGWMMWNFLVGVLLTPASIVLYDGNPATPTLDRLWDLAADAGITCFGTGAAYIAGCMKARLHPADGRDLSALTRIGATGSPLSPEGFAWVYDELPADTWLFSTSGGTDVCTAFVGGVPLEPVYPGELQARSLGCDVHSLDENDLPVVDAVGELVIVQSMPSMPLYFWNDPDGKRMHEAYFEMYPGLWRHGDWIELTARGTAIIYGRSDSTINRGGIRMGTSEIYRAVLALDEVVDALVVDVARPERENWMGLFVVLRAGVRLDDELTRRIAARIRADCSPRHVPDELVGVAEVPRTLSGKVLEVPVKRILEGMAPERAASRDSLANPAALDWFVEFARGYRLR